MYSSRDRRQPAKFESESRRRQVRDREQSAVHVVAATYFFNIFALLRGIGTLHSYVVVTVWRALAKMPVACHAP